MDTPHLSGLFDIPDDVSGLWVQRVAIGIKGPLHRLEDDIRHAMGLHVACFHLLERFSRAIQWTHLRGCSCAGGTLWQRDSRAQRGACSTSPRECFDGVSGPKMTGDTRPTASPLTSLERRQRGVSLSLSVPHLHCSMSHIQRGPPSFVLYLC